MNIKPLLLATSFGLVLSYSGMSMAEGSGKGGDGDDLHKLTTNKSAVDDLPTKRLGDRAFEALIEEMYPTTAEQLRLIKEKEEKIDNVIYDNKQPSALTEIIPVSTKPGAEPVTIFVAPLHNTTINVIDSTGQPWPVSGVMYGNQDDYKISKVEGHKFDNIVRVDPERRVGTTNVNIALAGLPTTITVTMKNNTDKYHPSPMLQIDKEGPQAKAMPVFSVDNVNSDEVLKNIVLGIAPDKYVKLRTSDPNVEAWRYDGSLFVRTTYHPSAPLPRGIHHGPSDYSAYRINDMPVIVMTTSEGYEKKILINGSVN